MPLSGRDRFLQALYRLVLFDAAKGEERASAQGVLLIVLLTSIALLACKSLGRVDEGYNRRTWVSLAPVSLTVLVADTRMAPTARGMQVALKSKFFGMDHTPCDHRHGKELC